MFIILMIISLIYFPDFITMYRLFPLKETECPTQNITFTNFTYHRENYSLGNTTSFYEGG